MAGILNNRTRIMDVLLTREGRRQMFSGELRAEFASFTDGQAFYEKDAVSGSTDATDRIMFEAVSRLEDSIIFEADDRGTTLGYVPDPNSLIVGKSIVITDPNSAVPGAYTIVTGSEYSSIARSLLTGSIDNIQKLQLLSSINPTVDQNFNFDLSKDDITFKITNSKPFGNNPDQNMVNVNTIEPLFLDKRLSHLPNFKFLPPVTRNGENFGTYADLNENHDLTYEQLISEIGPLPSIDERLDDETVDIHNEIATDQSFVDAFEEQSAINQTKKLQRESIKFQNTTNSNNMVAQVFEIRNEGVENSMQKLDIIDFGEFQDPNVLYRHNKHVFFVGRTFVDDVGFPTYVNIFTLVFD